LIKILHSADIHLDSPLASLALRNPQLRAQIDTATRAAFSRLVDISCAEGVAALLIAGDLFDGAARSAKTAAFLLAELDRLHAAGIALYYIKGNHDAENPMASEITLPANVHLFDGRGGKHRLPVAEAEIWVHGVSFSGRKAPESLLGKFQPPVPGAVNIAMLHTSLSGAAGHDPYAPCSVAELKSMGFDYWALGHIHKRTVYAEDPWIVMPGIPQGRDIGEDGPKSATLLEIDGSELRIREVATACAHFARHDLDLGAAEDSATIRARMRDLFRTLAEDSTAEALVLRLRLTGDTPIAWQMLRDRAEWEEIASDLARQTGVIWMEKLEFDLTDARVTEQAGAALGELARLMPEIADEAGFAAWCEAELAALLAALPPARRAALAPNAEAAEALGRRLALSGAQHVLARMKGTGG